MQKGQTALLLAARQNQLEAVNALLKAGARVDAQDTQGNTPLHEAARNNHINVMQVCALTLCRLFVSHTIAPPDTRGCFDVAEAVGAGCFSDRAQLQGR